MRTFIWCCLIAVLGGGLYGLARYASRNPDSPTGAYVKTACEVGCRSNPLLPSSEDEDIPSVPMTGSPTRSTLPGAVSIEDALDDPVPLEPVSFPSDPVATPLDPVDANAPILIREEDPVPREPTRVMPRTDDAGTLPGSEDSLTPASPVHAVEFPQPGKTKPKCEDQPAGKPRTMPRADEPGEKHGRAPSEPLFQTAWNDMSTDAGEEKTCQNIRPDEPGYLRALHQRLYLLLKENSSGTQPTTGRCRCVDTLEIRKSDHGWWTQIGWGPL